MGSVSNPVSTTDATPRALLEIAEGTIFKNFNDFATVFEEYIHSSKSPLFVISTSKTVEAFNRQSTAPLPLHLGYQFVTFTCAHNGKYVSQSTGTRPLQRTSKIGCPAKITVRYDRLEKGFQIQTFVNTHVGHAVDEHTFKMYSINRGVRAVDYLIPRVQKDSQSKVFISKIKSESEPIKSDVKLLVKYKAPVPTLKKYLRENHGVNISTQGIQNVKLRLKGKVEMPSCKKFVELLLDDVSSDAGMILETLTSNDTVQLVYFQYAWMVKFFAQYPDHILIDGTYCLNEQRMPLYIILAVDGNNHSVPVAFGLLVQETKIIVESFVNYFIKHNPSCKDIRSMMTDKDFTEISVLKKHFPQAHHSLCLFHVLKSFKEMVNSSNVPKDLKDKCKCLLEKMAYASSEELYNETITEFRDNFYQFNVFRQFLTRWHSCRQSWSLYYRISTYNLGDVTNNRLESLNQKLKQHIKKYAALDDFYLSLKNYLSNMLDKLEIAAFKDSTHSVNTFTDIPQDILERVSSCATYFAYKQIISQISEGLGRSCEFTHYANYGFYHVRLPNHRLAETTLRSCSCGFFSMKNLPCCHIFALRNHLKHDLFSEDLVPERWTKSHYLDTFNACRSSSTNIKTTTVCKYSKTASHNVETDRYSESNLVCKSLIEILKSSSVCKYDERLKFLKDLVNEWSKDTPSFEKPIQVQHVFKNVVNQMSDDFAKPNFKSNEVQPAVTCISPEKQIDHGINTSPKSLPITMAFPAIPKTKKNNKLTAIGRKRKLPKPSERLRKKKYRITDYFPVISKRPGNKQTNSSDLSDPDWVKVEGVQLKLSHKAIFNSNAWLDSDIIYAASCLLKNEYKEMEGLQHTTLQLFNPPRFEPCNGQFVQICNIQGSHWNCIAGKVLPEQGLLEVHVFDSLYKSLQPEVVSIASSLNRTYTEITNIVFKIHDVGLQPNSHDCGLFAIAFAKLICAGEDPCKVLFKCNKMRAHLSTTFESSNKYLTAFPATYDRVTSYSYYIPYKQQFAEKVYCLCRKTGDVRDLILCKVCLEFFHKKCLFAKNSTIYSVANLKDLVNFTCERCEISVVVIN